ncbi:SUMO protein smt3 [Vanrija albida]|uniref:SUMO protein smt3 n=1 Tax=Vanrija albida TaxID=181172 RepID=A0ABR3Q409_9TREE
MSSLKDKDVKPSRAALDGHKKAHQDDSDDSAARDIKPAIPGLDKQGIDFVKIGHWPIHPVRPDEIKLHLAGSKDGVHYKASCIAYPGSTIKLVKEYLRDVYGYEVAKLRLLYDGKILSNTDTMRSLEVEDGDTFDVYLEQLGGSRP